MENKITREQFDFKICDFGLVQIKVNCTGFHFNLETAKVLNNPEKVNIGIDRENRLIAIKPADEDETKVKAYSFVPYGSKNWISISCTKVVRVMEEVAKIKYTKKTSTYPAEYNKELGMLIAKF